MLIQDKNCIHPPELDLAAKKVAKLYEIDDMDRAREIAMKYTWIRLGNGSSICFPCPSGTGPSMFGGYWRSGAGYEFKVKKTSNMKDDHGRKLMGTLGDRTYSDPMKQYAFHRFLQKLYQTLTFEGVKRKVS